MPSLAEMNSATSAPASAEAMARRTPAMMIGMAPGSISFQNIWRLVARSERIISMRSSSVVSMPVNVFTNGAKNQTRVMMASLELKPKPSQAIISGPMAMRGVASMMIT